MDADFACCLAFLLSSRKMYSFQKVQLIQPKMANHILGKNQLSILQFLNSGATAFAKLLNLCRTRNIFDRRNRKSGTHK